MKRPKGRIMRRLYAHLDNSPEQDIADAREVRRRLAMKRRFVCADVVMKKYRVVGNLRLKPHDETDRTSTMLEIARKNRRTENDGGEEE